MCGTQEVQMFEINTVLSCFRKWETEDSNEVYYGVVDNTSLSE